MKEREDFARAVREARRVQGEGELSTGMGALMVLGAIAVLTAMGERELRRRGA